MSQEADISILVVAWINRRPARALAEYMQVTPQRVYQIKGEGRFPSDWAEECAELGEQAGDPFDRAWCKKRQTRRQAKQTRNIEPQHYAR